MHTAGYVYLSQGCRKYFYSRFFVLFPFFLISNFDVFGQLLGNYSKRYSTSFVRSDEAVLFEMLNKHWHMELVISPFSFTYFTTFVCLSFNPKVPSYSSVSLDFLKVTTMLVPVDSKSGSGPLKLMKTFLIKQKQYENNNIFVALRGSPRGKRERSARRKPPLQEL
jgi:hypothetical protein